MKRIFGLAIITLSLALVNWETAYFGFNWFPASVAELVADLGCLLLCVVGVRMFWKRGVL